MRLTPHEQEKLLVYVAALLARERKISRKKPRSSVKRASRSVFTPSIGAGFA